MRHGPIQTLALAGLLASLVSTTRAEEPSNPTPAAAPAASLAPPPGWALAASAPQPLRGRVGLGASVSGPSLAPAIHLMVDLPSSRTELEVGYQGGDSSATTLGLGFFGLGSVTESVRAYGGARAEFERWEAQGASSSQYRLAAAVGAEWIPTPAVALGVEGQLGYRFGSNGGSPAATSQDGLATTALVLLRVYPWSFAAGAASPGAPSPGAASPGAEAPPATRKARVTRCASSQDCDEGICFDGFCRR